MENTSFRTITASREAEFSRARALISQSAAIGVLIVKDGYVSVLWEPEDGTPPKWVRISEKDAAIDIVKQNAFDTIEAAIEQVKADTAELVEKCLEKGILKEKGTEIVSPFFSYVNSEKVSWSCKEELIQDLLYEPTWSNGTFHLESSYEFNPKSRVFLQSWYDAYVKTESEFPDLHNMLFGASDEELIFSEGADDHSLYYFNPDSNAGGQIVQCPFDDEMARRVIDGEECFEVMAERPQYLSDINHGSFFDTIESMIRDCREGKYIGNDNVTTMLEKIIKNAI